MPSKRCADCGLEKDHSEFYLRKRSGDGLSVSCKSCIVGRQQQGQGRAARRRSERDAWPLKMPQSISIRPDCQVLVANLPHDLSRAEARQIVRVLFALVDTPPSGEPL